MSRPTCANPSDFSSRARGETLTVVLVLLALALINPQPATAGGEVIFENGFESGDFSGWSVVVGLPPTPTVFRFSDLDLRDPHLFVEVFPFCFDFTDTPIPLTDTSFNGSIADLVTTDGDDDGFLDLSILTLFRPFDVLADALRLDIAPGVCTAPIDGTSCTRVVSSLVTTYDGLAAGTCLETLPGTTSGYSPGIDEPAAPCFATAAVTLALALGDVEVPLTDAQVAAVWEGDPVTSLGQGLLRGFLSEADADAVLLPPELPVVGGQPLSMLLPGGSGNCAGDDDRDLHLGVTGWWFYLNFTADQVEYTGI